MASQGFEVSSELREFAEKSMEQAKRAFDGFVSVARQAASAADSQAHGAQAGAKAVGETALRHTERNIARSFELAEKLVRAKDAQEAMALHADYVRTQIEALIEQARDLSQQAAKFSAGKAA